MIPSVLPSYLQTATDRVYEQISTWGKYSVRLIDAVSPFFQNWAVSTIFLIGFNIPIFEAAIRISFSANRVMESLKTNDSQPQLGNEPKIRSIFLATVFSGAVIIANYSVCRIFSIDLGTWIVVSIAIFTDLFWLIWKKKNDTQTISRIPI